MAMRAPVTPNRYTQGARAQRYCTLCAALLLLTLRVGLDLTGAQFNCVQHGALRVVKNRVGTRWVNSFSALSVTNNRQNKLLFVSNNACMTVYVFPLSTVTASNVNPHRLSPPAELRQTRQASGT